VPPGPAPNLYAVSVQGPGRTRWRVLVRAESEDAAAANVASRGHTVLGVSEGVVRTPPIECRARGACIRCGYTLAHLPAGDAGEIMCPECGVINVPDALTLRVAEHRARRRGLRLSLWLVIVAAVLLLWLSPLLMRLL
jgi:hypothetical protein